MNNLQEAVDLIKKYFYKVIKVDLVGDTYVEIVRTGAEDAADKHTYSVWVKSFVDSGCVHPNDVTRFKEFSSLDYVKKHKVKDYYRRLCYGEWRWVCFETEPCIEKDHIMVYVRDVHDSRVSGLLALDELRKIGNRDEETGVYNYQVLVDTLDNHKHYNLISAAVALFNSKTNSSCDMINLAQVLIDTFGKDFVYRMNESCFAVVLPNVQDRAFSKMMVKYYHSLNECGIKDVKQVVSFCNDGDFVLNEIMEQTKKIL